MVIFDPLREKLMLSAYCGGCGEDITRYSACPVLSGCSPHFFAVCAFTVKGGMEVVNPMKPWLARRPSAVCCAA